MPRIDKIKTTAGSASAELARRGVNEDDEVMLVIDLDVGFLGRRASRALVIAAGLTDEDIDRLIKEAREEVHQMSK
jgi:hypothetical protein